MRKWTFTPFEVLVELVRKRNLRSLEVLAEQQFGRAEAKLQTFRCPDREEVLAEAELQILGSQGRIEVRNRNLTPLEELAEQKCGTELMSHHG